MQVYACMHGAYMTLVWQSTKLQYSLTQQLIRKFIESP